MKDLLFSEVVKASRSRQDRWHKEKPWTISDWSNAVAGETGEMCNAVKKLRRIEDGIANINDPDRQISSVEEAIHQIGIECSDVFLYLICLTNFIHETYGVLIFSETVIEKFNEVSEKYEFPERLEGV